MKCRVDTARDEYEIDLDLVCASEPGVLPLMAGECVVWHGRLGPRHGLIEDAFIRLQKGARAGAEVMKPLAPQSSEA